MSNHDEFITYQGLVAKVFPQGKLRRTWTLQGGISAMMTAVEFEDVDGKIRRFIVRRPSELAFRKNPKIAENEFKILSILKANGLRTPQPYDFEPSSTVFNTPYLIIEYIEGEAVFSLQNSTLYSGQLAAQLARIHQLNIEKVNISFLPSGEGEYSGEEKRSSEHLNHSLAEERIRNTLGKLWKVLGRNKPALLHGDYWPGNVLFWKGCLAAVIDWEDAQIGDPLIDFSISRLDMLWIFGKETFQAYTQQYMSLSQISYTFLPFWDLCAALRFIRLAGHDLSGWASYFKPYGRADITEQTIRNSFMYFVEQALEKANQI